MLSSPVFLSIPISFPRQRQGAGKGWATLGVTERTWTHQLAPGLAGSGVLLHLFLGTGLCPCPIPSAMSRSLGSSGPGVALAVDFGAGVWGVLACRPWGVSDTHCQGWVPAPSHLSAFCEEVPMSGVLMGILLFCPLVDPSLDPGGGWDSDSLLKHPGLLSTFVISLPNLCPLVNTFPSLPQSGGNLNYFISQVFKLMT